jgi:glycosyltransferase involved in cell wall biosynthesis
MKKFSVVIPWSRRPELRDTLGLNAPLFRRHDVEVVVVNCGGDPGQVASLVGERGIDDLRYVTIPAASFNPSLARNLGAFCCSGKVLFFLDADIVIKSDIFDEVGPLLDAQPCFVKVQRVREARPQLDPTFAFVAQQTDTREMISVDGRKASMIDFWWADGSRCGSGLLLMNRNDLLAVGGFNSSLIGWGFEDIDLTLRLQFLLRLAPRAAGEVLHMTHGDDLRNVHGSSRLHDFACNRAVCFENYRRSRFVGTYADDVSAWQEKLVHAQHESRFGVTPRSVPPRTDHL